MITVPVFSKFGGAEPIGMLTIKEDAIPPSPNYHFAIGYRAIDGHIANGKLIVDKYELIEIAIVLDKYFAAYEA